MDPLFQTHLLNDQGIAKAKKLGEAFNSLLTEAAALGPMTGREWALAKTHLEEACFYAKKSLALATENQQAP